jgi:hypothetical protein
MDAEVIESRGSVELLDVVEVVCAELVVEVSRERYGLLAAAGE